MGCASGKEAEDNTVLETMQVGSHLNQASEVTKFPKFPDDCNSELKKCLTPAVWKKCAGKKDKAGVPFEVCIFSGCKNIDSGIGVYAGSHDSYKTFAPLFDQVVENYHKHGRSAKHVSNMSADKLQCPPFPEEDAKMIKSTRIRVGRNLKDYPLGPGISKEQRLEVESKVKQACETFTDELKGTYYSLGGMSEADRQQLVDDHFLFKEGDRFLEACNLNRDWPEGRGIFHNDAKTFLVWCNEEDQLRIISMQQGADIGAVFARLCKAVAHIEKQAKFAHDGHLGYITSCPTNLGTAMRASVHIALPHLSKPENKAQFQAIADKHYVQIRGIHGEHSESSDGVYDISNKRRLGRSEADLVQDMYNGVKEMIEAEKKLAA
jgi:creatine kinase/arginine kinase